MIVWGDHRVGTWEQLDQICVTVTATVRRIYKPYDSCIIGCPDNDLSCFPWIWVHSLYAGGDLSGWNVDVLYLDGQLITNLGKLQTGIERRDPARFWNHDEDLVGSVSTENTKYLRRRHFYD